MNRYFRQFCLMMFSGLLLVSLLIFIWLWKMSTTLTDEIRTPVPQNYQTWLQYPEQHGMHLQKIPCGQGQSQCFIASPDPQLTLAKRGRIMRQQLQAMSAKLSPQGEVKGILVLLHGRGSRKEFMLPIAERFVAAGFICVIPDLPAHGEHLSPRQYFATTPTEAQFAGHVLADARKHLNQPQLPAALWAMSLGSAFANRSLATDEKQWRAAVIVSGFDHLDGILSDKLDFLPDVLADPIHSIFKQLLKWRRDFDSDQATPKQWVQQVSLPVLVAHGDQDQLIRQARGRALFSAYNSKDKTWVNVSGGNHHNILITPMPLYATMGGWLLSYFTLR